MLSVGSIAAQPVSRNEERAVHNLSAQTEVFPQEKVYVHTDKPYYMAGDTIWLRAHVVDASSHVRTALSKYVYVELRSMEKPAFDEPPSAPLRIRIREREDVYAGYLPLPMTAKSGDYTLTAYTAFMRNAGPDYFSVHPCMSRRTAAVTSVRHRSGMPNGISMSRFSPKEVIWSKAFRVRWDSKR